MNRLDRLTELAETPRGIGQGEVYTFHEAEVWECGRCGFVMLAQHKDNGTDGYSCPACFDFTIGEALPDLLAVAREAEKQTTCENYVAPHSCLDEGTGRVWDSPYGAERVCNPCRLRSRLASLLREESES